MKIKDLIFEQLKEKFTANKLEITFINLIYDVKKDIFEILISGNDQKEQSFLPDRIEKMTIKNILIKKLIRMIKEKTGDNPQVLILVLDITNEIMNIYYKEDILTELKKFNFTDI